MNSVEQSKKKLYFLGYDLLQVMFAEGSLLKIDAKTQILEEGQYVKMVPLVISGLIKVFTRFEDKDLLLYYIAPNESCIMSFSAALNTETSKIFAVIEEDSEVLLLPSSKVVNWVKKYPTINRLFYQQYDQRYNDLLHTISEVIFKKLDDRLIGYLKQKQEILKTNIIKITHKQIAADLGTAREVISRLIKKLEKENVIRQNPEGIEIL